jgi:DNA repair exonuclease SbcCD ATPase subunit
MKEELSDLKAQMSWLDESFLLDPEVDAKKIYGYLKGKPSAAPFVYEKYTDLRKIITEISNPKNPLYLPKVRESLREVIDLESKKDDIKAVEEKLKALRNEKLKIEEEIHEKANQYDELDQRIMNAERRAEEIDRQMGNLTDPEILSMVKGFYSEFMAFSKSVLSSGDMTQLSLKIRTINTDQIQTLNLLTEKANSNLQVISNEDLVSEIKLSEKRSKLREQIEAEKEAAQREMNSFMAYNPRKLLPKILDDMANAMKKIEGADDDGAGGMYLNKFSSGFIRGNLQEGMKYTNYLMDQVENKERRAK